MPLDVRGEVSSITEFFIAPGTLVRSLSQVDSPDMDLEVFI